MYSYDRRTAREVAFTEHDIEQMRKDVLLLMKNVDRIEHYKDAQKFGDAVRTWGDHFYKQVYEGLVPSLYPSVRLRLTGQTNYTNQYQEEEVDKWVKYWEPKIRKECWDLHLVIKEIPLAIPALQVKYNGGTDDEAREHIFRQWEEAKKKWAEKVKREARRAWKVLSDFVQWFKLAKDAPSPLRTEREVYQQRLEGFSVRIIGYEDNGEDYYPKALELFKEALKIYRQRASQAMPLLLKAQLPFEFRYDCEMDLGGRYERNHIVVCARAGFQNTPAFLAKTLAHEMGHHIFKTYVSGAMEKFWDTAIHGDWGDLDLNDLLPHWHEGESVWDLQERLAHTDPVLSLQLEGLLQKHADQKVPKRLAELKAYLASGGNPIVRVPKHPITGYSTKNSEEAFCETIGLAVAYGPAALDPMVRGWMHTILPGEVKFASLAERVAQRHLLSMGGQR